MERLSDFKLIAELSLPDVGKIDTSGLILVVGPNSSGKSQLLRDVYARVSGEARFPVVATRIRLGKPDVRELVSCLELEGFVTPYVDEAGNQFIRALTTSAGSGQGIQQIGVKQPDEWAKTYDPDAESFYKKPSTFLQYFGKLLVTGLFLDRRLNSVGQVGPFDPESQTPQTDLHALFVDEESRKVLLDDVAVAFGKAIWLDSSKGGQICFRVNDSPALPSAEDRLSPKKMMTFRTIETEGDGLKSYVATCVALLLGRRPVCILDEPEMCLHPPQAFSLGKFIGKYGSSANTCTLVATHSSHILRGIIQTAPKFQIVRLTRKGAAFHAHRVDPTALAEAMSRPAMRAESVLDGVFAQGVVVLEADTDRAVYEATWETLQSALGFDIHFTTAGGTGGIATTVQLYRTLRIPVAVVADLDLLLDHAKIETIVKSISGQAVGVILKRQIRDIAQEVQSLQPKLGPAELKAALLALSSATMNWDTGDDKILKSKLSAITRNLDRARAVKGGISTLPSALESKVTSALEELAGVGLFLVPVGELEGWLSTESIVAPKENKPAWASEAAEKIRSVGARTVDVWQFIRRVGDHLRSL